MNMSSMRKMVFAAMVVTGHAVFAANTWYVDAENGNDNWNGKADFSNANPVSQEGPKKTLASFSSVNLGNGDTIYLAPGYYTNETVEVNSEKCRFYSSADRISLISTGSATNTFICGAIDNGAAEDEYGCGQNAIFPVMMSGNDNIIKGITIANGRRKNYKNLPSGTVQYGGGVSFNTYTGGNMMIDCVVTNCIANRGGGVYGVSYALRCRFTDNHAATEGAHAYYLANAVNCVFENTDGYAVYNNQAAGNFVNCLCRDNERGTFRATGGKTNNVYNSVFILSKNPSSAGMNHIGTCFINCFFDFDPTKNLRHSTEVPTLGSNCSIFPKGSLWFTSDGKPIRGNPAIGAAKATYYIDNFPVALETFGKDLDLVGGARTVGSTMDIGAVEHTPDDIYENDWFVDAKNGDNDNSGKTPALAKKTLVAIMDGRIAGDFVHAAPGVYSNDTVTVGEQKFRVSIPAGVSLISTNGAERTVILGEASENPDNNYGTGPGAVSCVHMSETSENSTSMSMLSGFTLSCGHSGVSDATKYGSAVKGSNMKAGIVADCIITNCVAGRGPVYKVGGVVRCRFFDNVSVVGAGGSIMDVNCICDSYFKNSYSGSYKRYMHDIYNNTSPGPSNGIVINCTFDTNGHGGPHAAGNNTVYVYNSVVKTTSDEGGAKYHNSVVTFGNVSSYVSDFGDTTAITNRDAVALTEESFRPVCGFNPAVGAGNYAYYTNLMPAAVAAVAGKDLWGNPRCVNGVLDAGAVACDRAAVKVGDTSTGLDVAGLEEDGLWHDAVEGAEYSLSRNYTSPKLLRGAYVNGEYVDFNANEDGWVYTGELPAAGAVEIVPDYAVVNDWYVDANFGNDANDGLRPGAAHAFKTLARASTNALMEAGATVYVAKGVYDSGIVPASIDSTDSRMMVPDDVHFVATGDRAETIVEGASSDAADAPECGIGPGAVRCCLLKRGSVRGFTMRYGNVNMPPSTETGWKENDQGGGILMANGDAFVYDCEIHNCNAVRGGGVAGSYHHGVNSIAKARLVRCWLHDNTNNVTGLDEKIKILDPTAQPSPAGTAAFNCSGYNTVVEGDCYRGTTWLNCTIVGKCWGAGTVFYNCYVGADGSASANTAAAFTNCVTPVEFKSHTRPMCGNCQENKTYTFSKLKNWRPRSRMSALFDTGDSNLYALHFPGDLAEDYAGFDFAGGVRILEGAIDVGAGEMIYDPKGTQIVIR